MCSWNGSVAADRALPDILDTLDMELVRTILRYWNTLRHLRFGQVWARLCFRLHRPTPDCSKGPCWRASTGRWIAPLSRPPSVFERTARFLSVERDIASPHVWNDRSIPKLWLYNLHYHEDLRDSSPQRREQQLGFIRRWMRENPPARGNGWEPYPVSLRVVNWICWAQHGGAMPDDMLQSLTVQTRWLTRRIEHHLLANHLFVNAKALTMVGLATDGPESDRWLRTGLRLLHREIDTQVLSDGGHYERSPMYHALILEDVLDLINAADAWGGRIDSQIVTKWRATASRMLRWLRVMTHPDGDISFFNDAALGIAPRLAEIEGYAAHLGVRDQPAADSPLVDLSDSGYLRATVGEAALLVDAAPIGPDEQPGHAHADTLSFELSLGVQRVIVNGGTSTYAIGAQRTHERSTRSHSTLELDGCDSSEVWAGFRVARRARVIARHANVESPRCILITAAHDGYRRIHRRAVHERTWRLTDRGLEVMDSMPIGSPIVRLLLHPTVVPMGARSVRLPNGRELAFAVDGGALRIEPATWSPRFGVIEPTNVVVVAMQSPTLRVSIAWT